MLSPSDLIRLADQYANAHPRRAHGGLNVIAGIDYQLRSHLVGFAQRLAEGNIESGLAELTHFLETLSDEASLDTEGRLVCVQMKTTLTPESLRAAAEEFVLIDEFLEGALMERHREVLFGVVASRSRLLVKDDPWSGVTLRTDSPEGQRRQQRWASMKSSGRIREPKTMPDPTWRLIAVAWPHLDDPVAFAREAYDLAGRRGNQAASVVAENIAQRWAQRAEARRHAGGFPGMILSGQDTELAPRGRRVLLGQRPTLRDLREGCFIRRDAVVRSVLSALAQLEASIAGLVDQRLPLLFIHGKSGTGKSIALMQAMAELTARGDRVLWLDDNSSAVVNVLQAWVENPVGMPHYLCIDDLLAPQQREDLDLPGLGRLLRAHAGELPILLTCGPPEHLTMLKQHDAGEVFSVAEYELGLCDPRERESVREWYEARTGRPAQASFRSGEEGGGLMMSILFELEKGDLREFGTRFVRRLEDLSLRVPLTPILACNRLYLSPPSAWLSARDRDALDRLNVDEDFSFVPDLRGGTSVRLMHPHLAAVVYLQMTDDDGPRTRAEHLLDALERSLRTAPGLARHLLARLASGGEELDCMDEATLVAGVARIWRQHCASEGSIADDADAWTSLAYLAERSPAFRNLIGEAHLRALKGLDDDRKARGWAATWQRLIDVTTESSARADAIRVGRDWLEGRQDRQDWNYVWQRLVDLHHGEHRIQLLSAGKEWLAGKEDRPDWAYVWRKLLDVETGSLVRRELVTIGRGWLVGRENRPEWPHVLRALLGADVRADVLRELAAIGRNWLRGREDRADWNYLWQTLVDLSRGERRLDLLGVGRQWLAGKEDRPDWAHVWRKVVSLWPWGALRDELLAMGCDWLEYREGRAEWPHVWRILVDVLPGGHMRDQLVETAWNWLKQSEDRAEWSHVWRRLVRERSKAYNHADLLRAGTTWLETKEDGPGWAHLWVPILRMTRAPSLHRRLLTTGMRWLLGRRDAPNWVQVWQELIGAEYLASDRETLNEAGIRWLDMLADHPFWCVVWRRVLELEPQKTTRLLDTARRWLSMRSENTGWAVVWLTIADLERCSATLQEDFEMGRRWLDRQKDHHDWAKVWRRLIGSDSHSNMLALLTIGRGWLAGRRIPAEWADVWCMLMAHEECTRARAELLAAAWTWLRMRQQPHAWVKVWSGLVEHEADRQRRAELLDMGLGWLRRNMEESTWHIVWRILWANKGRPELAELARVWLATTPSGAAHTVASALCSDSAQEADASAQG